MNDYLIGLRTILKRIEENEEGKDLSHNEVRAFARCFLAIAKAENRSDHIVLLTAMAARGLAHYDRSFLAKQLIELIDKEIDRNQSYLEDQF